MDLEEAPESVYPLGKAKPYQVKRTFRGREIDMELVKRLSEPRIFEMNADNGAEFHQFIYFPYYYKDEPGYVFVYGLMKVHGKPDITNFYITKAKQLYEYVRRTKREKDFFEG